MSATSHGNVHRRVWQHKGQKRQAWEYSFVYQRGGQTLRARGQADTREAALAAMAARKVELAQEAEAAAAPVTVAAFSERWIETLTVAQRTRKSYTETLRRHVLPTLGNKPLGSVTRGDVVRLLTAKRAALQKNSVRLVRATISSMYSAAIGEELVAANPALKLGKLKGPDSMTQDEHRGKVKTLERDQLDVFLAAAGRDRSWPIWLFLADTGCRPSEALALQWDDVDLIGRTAYIHRARDLDGSLKDTKTHAGRHVDLSARLVAALDRHQTFVEAAALAAGRDVNPLVFPSESGTTIDVNNLARLFRKLLVRAGLPKVGSIYILRHTWASHALTMGAPLPYVSAQLGHASSHVTLTVYTHFMAKESRGVADQLEQWRRQGAAYSTLRSSF